MNSFDNFIQETTKAAQGTRVYFDTTPIRGYGYIRGIATTMPISYIIEMEDPIHAGVDPEVYPYSCIVVPGWMVEIANTDGEEV
jgi:hypothetical protein